MATQCYFCILLPHLLQQAAPPPSSPASRKVPEQGLDYRPSLPLPVPPFPHEDVRHAPRPLPSPSRRRRHGEHMPDHPGPVRLGPAPLRRHGEAGLRCVRLVPAVGRDDQQISR